VTTSTTGEGKAYSIAGRDTVHLSRNIFHVVTPSEMRFVLCAATDSTYPGNTGIYTHTLSVVQLVMTLCHSSQLVLQTTCTGTCQFVNWGNSRVVPALIWPFL